MKYCSLRFYPLIPLNCAKSLKFYLDSDFIPDLLKKKSAAIEHPVEYFQKAAELFTGNKFIDSEQSRSFIRSIDYLLKKFEYATIPANELNVHLIKPSEKKKPIDLIFDGNIRSLLRNAIRAHHHKIRLSKVSEARTLIEGSVLAGCNSIPENFDDTVHGHWCPNLFETATMNQGRWTGLAVIRIIQLLDSVRNGMTRTEVISFIGKNFLYSDEQCRTAFQTAAEFSLIRSEHNRDIAFNEELGRPISTRLYSTTPKGRYILKLAFEDYATFYFMAVGTPLDLERLLLKGIDLQFMIHSSEEERHFFRAAILAGFVLWAHIYTANHQELNRLDKHLSVNCQALPPAAFDLPSIDLWPVSAVGLLRRLFPGDLRLVSDVFERYVSAI